MAEESSNTSSPTHLVLLVNGIWGGRWDWTRFAARLVEHPSVGPVLVHASGVNTAFRTGDGIDVCGRRLAAEVAEVVAAHPTLTDISIVGHSMGGLIARYAVGVMAAPDGPGTGPGVAAPGTLLEGRLRARTFVTIATPHLACASSHPEEGVGGWVGGLVIRALSLLHAKGIIPLPKGEPDHPHDDANGGPPAAITWPPPSPEQQQQQDRRGVHALIAGPQAAVANRSVSQLIGVDRQLLPAAAWQGQADDGVAGGPMEEAAAAATAAAAAAAAAAVPAAANGTSATRWGSGSVTRRSAEERAPLLDIMTQDWPGLAFMSGLRAFNTRAAFSSAGGDHLIPWPSSSLRYAHELPVYEPLPWTARGPEVAEDTKPHPAPGGGGAGAGGLGASISSSSVGGASAGGGGKSGSFSVIEATAGGPAPDGDVVVPRRCMGMRGRLAQLQLLQWRRFDVVWPRWALQFFAHNGIQMNGPTAPLGLPVADKIIELLVEGVAGAEQQESAAAER